MRRLRINCLLQLRRLKRELSRVLLENKVLFVTSIKMEG